MPDENEPKKNNKLIIIIIAAVALLIGGGGAAFFMLGGEEANDEESVEVSNGNFNEPASYVNIPEPFLFNVAGEQRDRLVQIKVQIMVRGTKNEELARHHSPLIESTLLATFGAASQEQLLSPTGRTELREQATEDIKQTLVQVVGEPIIEAVLFTDFVIQ